MVDITISRGLSAVRRFFESFRIIKKKGHKINLGGVFWLSVFWAYLGLSWLMLAIQSYLGLSGPTWAYLYLGISVPVWAYLLLSLYVFISAYLDAY